MKPLRKLTEPQLAALRAAAKDGDAFTAALAAHELKGRCQNRRALRTAAQSTIAALWRRGFLEFAVPHSYKITLLGRAAIAAAGNGGEPAGDGLSITGEMPTITPAPGAKPRA